MKLKDFQKLSVRTMNPSLTQEQQICNCIIGIQSEAGEMANEFKKNFFQGHALDLNHVHEELGDVMFYIVNLATLLDLDMEEIIEANYDKLMKRFPDGFTAAASIARVDKEK